jgi:ABC-type antimicrobial peptide transport system permease subunit
MPFDGSLGDERIQAVGSAAPVGIRHTLPGFFETLRVPLLLGRTLSPDDAHADPNAAIVSASGARALFGDTNPIGQTFTSQNGRTFHVVGLTADITQRIGANSAIVSPAEAFVMPGAALKRIVIVVRVRTENGRVLDDLQNAVNAASPGAQARAVWWSDTISTVTAFRNPRFQTMVLGVLGGVALLLTAFGIVGVIGFLVVSRTRELAIRTAIGATPESLTRMVVRQGLVPVVVGLIAGLIATHWAGRLAETQLFKVDTKDMTTIALTATVVIVTTVVAAYVPSRRAARVNPLDVLRTE